MAGANTNPMNPIMTSKVIHCHNDSDRGPVIALKVDSHEEQTTGVDGVKLLVNKKTTVLTLEYVINHAMPSTGRISVEKTCLAILSQQNASPILSMSGGSYQDQ